MNLKEKLKSKALWAAVTTAVAGYLAGTNDLGSALVAVLTALGN